MMYLILAENIFLMRVKKSSNVNMRFLFGAVVFFAVIIFVVMLFTYFTVKYASENKAADVYTVSFSKDFVVDSCVVSLDGFVVYAAPATVDSVIHVDRSAMELDEYGKKRKVERFGPSSILRVELPGKDTVVETVGDGVAFRISFVGDSLSVER